MSGAPWWVVLAAAAVGATAAIVGAVWASRVQRRSATRAEWFRRLQWAWEQTDPDQTQRVAAGMAVMDYVAASADKRDAEMILAITPIRREVGRLASKYSSEEADLEVPVNDGHTQEDDSRQRGGDHEEGHART